MLDQLIQVQKWVYGSLGSYLSAFAATRDWMALAAVLPLGIVFGAVHALTPGHGKSILASYLVGSRLAMLRAIMVAAVLALTHVGSAVILAVAALPLVTRTLAGVGRAPTLEIVSRTLLAVIGVWLIVRAIRTRPHLHAEGVTVGFVAGLVPCPLTLFVMLFAISRQVPEAGLIFAVAMMFGVLLTLSAVALITVIGRDWLLRFLSAYGGAIDWMTRGLDAFAGLLLVGLSLNELAR